MALTELATRDVAEPSSRPKIVDVLLYMEGHVEQLSCVFFDSLRALPCRFFRLLLESQVAEEEDDLAVRLAPCDVDVDPNPGVQIEPCTIILTKAAITAAQNM